MLNDSDEALVRGAQAGDRGAFEEMVRRTSRLVFARLYLETGDSHRAEDLLQETLLNAYRSLRNLADPKGFRPWLLKIAQNVALDAARHDLRRKRAVPGRGNAAALAMLSTKEPSPEEQVEREELRGQILAILRSLPEEYRLPLTLRYIGGADYETIQTQLGLSNGSLRGLLHRGLKMLRARLPRDFEKNAGEQDASACEGSDCER
jgi:RNA polymerase sigma-70 factor (ECF subfamily)